ncbi:6-phosphogluconolactonase [bacterium]|nr:6-phosphogluconolactonase [bacterium]
MSASLPERRGHKVLIEPTADRLALVAAENFVTTADTCVADHGRFTVALSGGSTPKALFRLLATGEFQSRIDWTKTHLFWSDERCVAPGSVDSNFRMACETLIDNVKLPQGNVHPLNGLLPPAEGARQYEAHLREFFAMPTGFPRFDLILLGMGDDGHTASLFPGQPGVHETTTLVTTGEKGYARLSFTPPMINAAARVWLLVAGAGKAEMIRTVFTGDDPPETYPVKCVDPTDGEATWYLDEAAAALWRKAG